MDEGKTTGVEAAYDAWAGEYDTDENRTRDLDAAVLRSRGFDLARLHVLEVGCGTGKNTVWLAEQAPSVTALDFSERMLEKARARVPAAHVRFQKADITRPWPVRSASVDFVTANLVLEHVEDLAPVFAEAARVLRSCGTLWISELHPYRQLRGSRARFTDPGTGETVPVPAFLHDVSDFVNAGLSAGMLLAHVGEWRDEADGPKTALPRLFTAEFRRL